jgi:hypothetical protein
MLVIRSRQFLHPCLFPSLKKLTPDNFRLCRAQVLSAIRVTQLESFIDGSDKAPANTIEIEKDSKTLWFQIQTM